MDKAALYATLLSKLDEDYRRMHASAQDTADRAQEGEGRMKSRYDTKRIESSYLADGLSGRVDELEAQLRLAHDFRSQAIRPMDIIQGGALTTVRQDDVIQTFYILPFLAGEELLAEGELVQIMTGAAPLAKALIGKRAGEEVSFRGRSYRIDSVS